MFNITNESKQYKWNRAGETENLTVKDWINSTKWFKHVRKMRRAEVSFNTNISSLRIFMELG